MGKHGVSWSAGGERFLGKGNTEITFLADRQAGYQKWEENLRPGEQHAWRRKWVYCKVCGRNLGSKVKVKIKPGVGNKNSPNECGWKSKSRVVFPNCGWRSAASNHGSSVLPRDPDFIYFSEQASIASFFYFCFMCNSGSVSVSQVLHRPLQPFIGVWISPGVWSATRILRCAFTLQAPSITQLILPVPE